MKQTCLVLTAFLSSCPAFANPRPLPFSYFPTTQPEGGLELEQFVDLIPVRVPFETDGGTQAVSALRFELQTEIEFGLTDWLELGWYFVFRQNATPVAPNLRFQGMKQRARIRLAPEGEWPVNVGLYFEVAEYHDELELEQKVLLSRRIGDFHLVTNLWVEQEYYFQTDEWKLVYNPTLGVTYQFSPAFILGAEYWARGRFDEPLASSDEIASSHHYAGPTLMLQTRGYWLSLGAFLRLDDFGRETVLGDPWGKVWVRTIIGLGF